MAEVVLFAGPSAVDVPDALLRSRHIKLRGPAQRGSVDAELARSTEPGVLILCDGLFQSVPAVSHVEICAAIDSGWQVYGVSSIGAIRAYEMRHEGVRGFGYVYEQFEKYADFTDDEVCLLHLPMAPYRSLTEPLVNVRYALERRGAALGIDARGQAALIGELGRLWFGDRTPERIKKLLVTELAVDADAACGFTKWLSRNSVKSLDLRRLLSLRPWARSK